MKAVVLLVCVLCLMGCKREDKHVPIPTHVRSWEFHKAHPSNKRDLSEFQHFYELHLHDPSEYPTGVGME